MTHEAAARSGITQIAALPAKIAALEARVIALEAAVTRPEPTRAEKAAVVATTVVIDAAQLAILAVGIGAAVHYGILWL